MKLEAREVADDDYLSASFRGFAGGENGRKGEEAVGKIVAQQAPISRPHRLDEGLDGEEPGVRRLRLHDDFAVRLQRFVPEFQRAAPVGDEKVGEVEVWCGYCRIEAVGDGPVGGGPVVEDEIADVGERQVLAARGSGTKKACASTTSRPVM